MPGRCASHSFSLVRDALASIERVCGQGVVDEHGALRRIHVAGSPSIFSVGVSAQPGIGARQADGMRLRG
ncbi:hypothetical protein D9613_012663 [Agrocybe pediades]|uniref:Uncharacterized protein n=1 Tax=Agrocybe pediades TaxID=84607 RepID=A0A8H4QVD3_9AGAR|nr:hypothetical protein D9613_012631 [Agrocybe pediades]KAF4618092.1 hypothetical protein D9613_012663 [Agrocybe pediades]